MCSLPKIADATRRIAASYVSPLGTVALLASSTAYAASTASTTSSETLFIAQIVVLLIVGRVLGEVLQRFGQPAVIGQLLAGVLLGPSVFGALWPHVQQTIFPGGAEQKAMLAAVADLGILMVLLLAGMDAELTLVRKLLRPALSVSALGFAVPFGLGIALGYVLPAHLLPHSTDRLVTSLFLGTALSVASVKIVATVLRDMNFIRHRLGAILIVSAIIDDVAAWTMVAIVSGLASRGIVDLPTVLRSTLGTAAFLVLSFTFGRSVVFALMRWTNDTLVSEAALVTAIIIVTGTMALVTHLIGIHTALGAFVAGILVGDSPILTRHVKEHIRSLVVALFMPVFFASAGFNATPEVFENWHLLGAALALIVIASVGKGSGAFLGGALAGFSRRESLVLACGMNARGSTEIVIASFGLSLGLIGSNLFTMIVTMAIATTLAMPPTLRWALRRVPMREDEKSQLAREAAEGREFLTRVQRLLVVVDHSANGRLALQLAGRIAESRRTTITVLRLAARMSEVAIRDGFASTSAEAGNRAYLTLRTDARAAEVAVSQEVQKGYGMLMVGIENSEATPGVFHEKMSRIATAYAGPLALVFARGKPGDTPRSTFRILVPVRGNSVSRHAAEVAFALIRPGDPPMTAFYAMIAHPPRMHSPQRERAALARRVGEAVLSDIAELAHDDAQPVRTLLRVAPLPEDAILRQARLGRYTLIVMGVGRPAGKAMYFGKIATHIMEKSEHSILLLCS